MPCRLYFSFRVFLIYFYPSLVVFGYSSSGKKCIYYQKHHVFIILYLKNKMVDDAADDLTPDFFGDINIRLCPLKSQAPRQALKFFIWNLAISEHSKTFIFFLQNICLGGFSLIAASLVSTIVTILKLFRGMHALYFDFPYVAFIVSEASS